MKRSPAALAAIAAAAAAAAWLVVRSYQQDFAAYWVAAASRRAGLDPYVNAARPGGDLQFSDGIAIFRHSRFLYPPLIADLFRPFLRLGYLGAKGLFTGAMVAAWIGAGLVVAPDRRGRTVFFVASALFFPIYRHFERGQIDLLILLLLALAWRARAHPWLAGAALAAGAAFKPTFLGLVPVLWGLGRARAALAALAVGAGLVVLTAIVDGPGIVREYAVEVLPRASLYGEGGTEEMLLPPDRLPAEDGDGTIVMQGRRYQTEIGDAPAAASLPRLLAPDTPTPATARLPFLLAVAGLTRLAHRLRRRGDPEAETLLFWAAAVACVVASPAGWVMGLVLALPLAPTAAALLAEERLPRRLAVAAAVAWAAVAAPAPFGGFPALAACGLIAVAVAAAHRTDAGGPA